MNNWIFLAAAAAAGVLMAIQGSLNGALGKIIGVLEGNFILHGVGLLIVAILLFLCGLGKGDLSRMGEAPWYLYLGGVINVAIIYGVMFSIAQVGAGNATTAIIVGQLAMAMLVDCFGWFGLQQTQMTWSRGAGVLLLGLAANLMLSK
ncbi:MAG: DMT family transporter [Firmicutes bacterium]|nr:DMT family transporter [Bacillota bacterium]